MSVQVQYGYLIDLNTTEASREVIDSIFDESLNENVTLIRNTYDEGIITFEIDGIRSYEYWEEVHPKILALDLTDFLHYAMDDTEYCYQITGKKKGKEFEQTLESFDDHFLEYHDAQDRCKAFLNLVS